MPTTVENLATVLNKAGFPPEITPRDIRFDGGRVTFTPSMATDPPRNIAIWWESRRDGNFDLAIAIARALIDGFSDEGVMKMNSMFSRPYHTDGETWKINDWVLSLQVHGQNTVLDFLRPEKTGKGVSSSTRSGF